MGINSFIQRMWTSGFSNHIKLLSWVCRHIQLVFQKRCIRKSPQNSYKNYLKRGHRQIIFHHSFAFSTLYANVCLSCLAVLVMHPHKKMYLFHLRMHNPRLPTPVYLNGDEPSTYWWFNSCKAIRLPLASWSLSRPRVYRNHHLSTTSSTIWSTNGCVVGSINLQAVQAGLKELNTSG